MLGFELGFWDCVTLATLGLAGMCFVVLLVFVMELSGQIAMAREHLEAEAVNIIGWTGVLAVTPWIQAFIWAFKPTDVVDIRCFPKEEQLAIREENVRLKGVSNNEPKNVADEPQPAAAARALPAGAPVPTKPAPARP
jgi:hypothetical protein